MDNREAISQLESLNKEVCIYSEAIALAIAALEQREKALDEWCTDCKEYDKEQHCCHRFTKVIRQAVEEHRREWPDSKWIPETERLPEKDGNYLVTLYDSTERWTEVLYWNSTFGGRWQGLIEDDLSDIGNVSAWRPLPKPYQEEEA